MAFILDGNQRTSLFNFSQFMTPIYSLLACATCANSFKHGGQDAAGWAIALMLLVIVPLVTMVVWFMVKIAKRERAGLDPQFCDDYVAPANNS
jgi:Na+/melibiose symporter-like transporter